MGGMINHTDGDNGNKVSCGASERKLVTSFFNLIRITLYSEEKYEVINQPYYVKNSKGEFEKYEMYFHFDGDEKPTLIRRWRDFKEYVEHKMMYI